MVQETIAANVSEDTVTLEFQRSDGTLVTQLIDFRNVSISSYTLFATVSAKEQLMMPVGARVNLVNTYTEFEKFGVFFFS